MIIHMVRHGLTEGNAQRRYVGATDMPLSEEGLRLARAGKRDEAVRQVYVTPLRRTQQTAAILYPNARQVIVPDLREMNFGAFEGRTYEELENDADFLAWNNDGGMQPSPGGEGRLGFSQRATAALTRLIEEAAARGEEEIRILAHGGTIMSLMAVHALPQKPYYEWWVDNMTGYRVQVNPADWAAQPVFAGVERVDMNAAQA